MLSIAGTDPTGGAGIQADIKSIAASGGYAMAVVTSLVAQNTRGVRSVHTPPTAFLAEQLAAVGDDVRIDAVKIGMLGTAPVAREVRRWLDRVRPPVVVLDPVMVATSGDRLLDREAEDEVTALLGMASLVTPNVPELAVLTGLPPAVTWEDVIAQALQVSQRHGVTVLAKGGHLDGDVVLDAFVDAAGGLKGGRTRVDFPGPRIDTTTTHGTGCSLSAALATTYARFGDWEHALGETKRWLTESIRHGAELKVGAGNGPISHFAGLWSRGGLETRPTAPEIETEWWKHVADLRAEIGELPFLKALRNGTLDPGAFARYLAQDALYLRENARLLAEAGSLAPTTDTQVFWGDSARAAITSELVAHLSRLAPAADVPADATTTAYLNHLARAARSGYAVLVAALLPCFWIYQDLGRELHLLARPEHPYRSWLESYADDEFAVMTRRAIDIVTAAAAEADDATRHAMRTVFRESARHERDFFAAPLAPEPTWTQAPGHAIPAAR
ncbi:bifunctional hydroxymethylpyrimidine kinase/phosphomethylpyrimidine kinase (plasmid) [Streptomyces sp. NBC_01216]|uniref:bifunctional hydroxymethylpyrimidine kinase/phosphomethylpyrimidine kinase n=1 Tax=Streptomyces sp. NBC_01216 TaxID=2903778 RepID=UPI002E14F741|nr:bifunctional hydroxymethylpyrimidine kinase/phosphomethylpyrimidine kinase [Streptomyces sp. NBC_01216]